MKIVICAPVIPWPTVDGLRVRMFNLARELTGEHQVHLFCLSNEPATEEQRQAIAAAGLGLTVVVRQPMSVPAKAGVYLKGLARGIPPELILSWEQRAFDRLSELHREHRFDVVAAEHLFMARYALALDCPRLFVEHNVEGPLMAALALREKPLWRIYKRATAAWIARYEKKILSRMQAITAVTEADAQFFRRAAPGVPVTVVPNGVNVREYAAEAAAEHPAGHKLLFIGLMSYLGNAEAAEWCARQVFPAVRQRYPDATFTIAGRDPLPQVRQLAREPGVSVTGYVEDVRPYYRESSVMVVPLQLGGGSRLKILESFAAGTAVVSTTKGAEGLAVENGRHLLIADGPDRFAGAVIRILEDDRLRGQLTANALALVKEEYDWRVLARSLEEALAGAVEQRPQMRQGELGA